MKAATHVARGADDELIHVEEFGEPGGMPVLVHSGSPGSRRLFRPDTELAARGFGLRLLSYDRPGYGGRPRRQGRAIADAVTDVRCAPGWARRHGRTGVRLVIDMVLCLTVTISRPVDTGKGRAV